MALRLRGSTSGFVEIDAPAEAGDVTLTLPSTAGTVNVKDASGNTEVGTGVTLGNPSADIFTINNIGGERLRIASDGTVTIPGVVSSLNVAGVVTATSFSGGGLGISSVFNDTTPQLGGSLDLNGNNITGTGNVNITGIITATSFSGDGSALSGIQAGIANFVASGAIPNGDTVVINTDGTVGIVTQTTIAVSAGTPVVYNSATATSASAIYDPTNNKVVIAYKDNGNSSYGTAVVGTVSGTSISFGTPVVFESATTNEISATYDSSNGKVVIAYQDVDASYRGTAVVGTVSGNSISFGTPEQFETGITLEISATYDSSNGKVVIAYRDQGNGNRGTAVVGTVSGTSISFGTPVVFESATTFHISATYDSSNNKVVIAYQDEANLDYGTAVVGTVSGTSISFGTPVVFESSDCDNIAAVYDSTNQRVVIAYRNDGNLDYGTAVVGTVSGTSISFGTPVVFESANTENSYMSATFDSTNNNVVIVYGDGGNSFYGTVINGTVSDTSISFGTPVVFESANTSYLSVTYDSTNDKSVVVYRDNGNSFYGTSVVLSSYSLVTNLTTENYIGIAAESISDGQTGKVNIVSGINTSQTGLTTGRTYYVQIGGGISTVPSNPSVVAGTSISDTKIIVR